MVGRLLFAALGWAHFTVAHPIHTTIADLAWRPETRTVRVMIRVFDDDFGRAILGLGAASAPPSQAAVTEAAAMAYVRTHFLIADDGGHAATLASCGLTRSANVVWVCAEAGWSGSLSAMRVHSRMLFDLYRDQINIVQAHFDGRSASLLFVQGDGPKPLP